MKMKIFFVLLFATLLSHARAQNLPTYFPPNFGNWENVTPESLGWCTNSLDSLSNFLDSTHTKAFILLHHGKIVVENYYGTFTQDSLWYWASAGKSLTSFLVGKAQEEGFLSIDNPTNSYIGTGFTSCTPEQENNITVRHQLTMTTGLDDNVPDNHCFTPECLLYLADPGTRWAYHNAPYTLLDSVLESTTGMTYNAYTYSRVGSQIGMYGLWITLDNDHVYFSKAREFARFGLLMQNHANWNGNQILNDAAYYNAMITPSNTLNESYGYLWWLNGQTSFMLPQSQFVFPGKLLQHAPNDVYAALGKNGQIINVCPSRDIVFIRMGNIPNSTFVPNYYNDDIWKFLNNALCDQVTEHTVLPTSLFPNPVTANRLNIQAAGNFSYLIYDMLGQKLMTGTGINSKQLDTSSLPSGIYLAKISSQGKTETLRFEVR